VRDEERSSPSAEARALFARHAAQAGAGGVDIEALCRQVPTLAAELRRLNTVWQAAAGPSGAEASVSMRIESLVGRDVAPVALDAAGDTPAEATAEPEAESPETLRIGRYRLQSEVARGGQGAIVRVFDQDLRRQLAMKLILGPDGGDRRGTPVSSIAPRVLGRFLDEAQVTAQLDHPGIVPVHELGLDPEGRVYFTMKLVQGEDLSAVYAKVRRGAEGWSLPRALTVLVKACEAVAFAHHKGVIHRDLKPANVMVGRFGEVYVMDWGLARVLRRADGRDLRPDPDAGLDDLGEDALVTMDGDVVGTPAYMPPEQARGELAAMGAHSDVYSLGAMLYELLAGHEPYARPGARPGVLEVLFKVQAEAPEPLARRAPDAPPELVAICEKAMSRDPAARYADMSGLAEDLRAYLEGRVVHAHETGALAELRKWIGRNKPLAGAMAGGVLALVAGLATTWVQKTRADHNAALAEEREALALSAQDEARAEAERANREAETARRTAGFLVGLFEVSDPGESRGNTITAREILDRGAERIESDLADQPEVQAALMETMGTVYASLGLYGQALPLLERSLVRRSDVVPSDDLLVAGNLTEIGRVRRLQSEYAAAERDLRQALEIRRARLGDEHAEVAEVLHELGVALSGLNRLPEAEELFRRALAQRRKLLGAAPPTAESLAALAFNLYDQGDRDSGEALLREALEIRRTELGEHPDTAESLNDLGVYLFERQASAEAEELLRAALEMKRRLYTEIHPEVALSLNNLAVAYHTRGALAEAEPLYLEALEIQRRLLGGRHPDIAQAMHNVAILRQNEGDWEGARELFLESLAMYVDIHGADHPSLARPLRNTSEFLAELAEVRRAESGEESRPYAAALVDLSGVLVLSKRPEEALDAAFQALEILGEEAESEPCLAARAEGVLGAAWTALGQLDEAEEVLLRSFQTLRDARGVEGTETQETVARLVDLYQARRQPEEAGRFAAWLTSRGARGE